MAKFQISVSYTGYSFVDFLDIEAENRHQAIAECEKIKRENAILLERCEANNVFLSRRVKECRLRELSFKEEMRKCEELLNELKNDI